MAADPTRYFPTARVAISVATPPVASPPITPPRRLAKNPKAKLEKLPNYFRMFSSSKSNGVFVFCQDKNNLGPAGFDLRKYPGSGNARAGLIGFTVVFHSGNSYIIYSEAAPRTESAWLKESPCASRSLGSFLGKLVKVAKNHSDQQVRTLAGALLNRLGLEESWLLGLHQRSFGRRLNPKDEDRLAKQFALKNVDIIPN